MPRAEVGNVNDYVIQIPSCNITARYHGYAVKITLQVIEKFLRVT